MIFEVYAEFCQEKVLKNILISIFDMWKYEKQIIEVGEFITLYIRK